MKPNINKHGLSRYIPEDIKREIRKKSGFGCVICGKGIYEYDHINPEFNDAKTHDPNGITLLCGQCHSKKTRKFLSRETILEMMANPVPFVTGFVNESMDIKLDENLIIKIGAAIFTNCPIPIVFKGKEVLKISKPSDGSTNILLSGIFFDSIGNKSLIIENNEWKANTENWDIITKGGELIIKNEFEPFLIMENDKRNILNIKFFKTEIGNMKFVMSDQGIFINNSRIIKEFIAENCQIGMMIG
ncbi:HNH endonuclease signature motif containing protein [Chryseobacterium polytrichastri]|nr:HNH endonuclease signature motif containing protein [Chryseobacterium polytrichastri]